MKNVSLVAALSTFRGLGFSSIWVFSALYLRTVLGLSIFQDGLIITMGSGIAAVLQIYGGSLSDRFGYKRTIIISFVSVIILYAIIVSFTSARNSSLWYPVLFVGLMVSNTVQTPAASAIVSHGSEVKLKGFSILRIGNNIGWGIGPAIGGFLISFSGYYFLFVFGLATAIAGLVISAMVKDVRTTGNIQVKFHAGNGLLMVLSVAALLLFIVQAQETVTLSNYAKILRHLDYLDIGILYLTNGIAVILTQGLVYRVSRRLGNYWSFILGGFLYSFGFFSYAFFSGLEGMILATVIFTFGEDFAFPAGLSMVSMVSKPENIGKNMGTYNAFISAGRALGPLLGGYVLSFTVDPYIIWGVTTLPGFIGVLIILLVFRGNASIQEDFTHLGG